jgi:hypothetical protein
MIGQSRNLESAYRESIEYWEPDAPPVTVLFSALGDQVAEHFDSTDDEVNRRIFDLIETAMKSGENELVVAVATGTIEAVVARAFCEEGLWNRIAPMLGTLSKQHAQAWLAS